MKTIPCEYCDRPLDKDADGWVAWYEDPSDRVVKAFFVTCRHPCAKRARCQIPHEWSQRDHHLGTFTGRWAFSRFARLMIHYRWEKETAIKCAEFFIRAQHLKAGADEWGNEP